ncbi:DUF6920 family protein [Halanaerobacter jeridensis]|uniref:Uncharacterized protein n=1 Tax=Halanaerobacter jeridensis TaxID=706427 RepID=A0A938XUC7_9FIRM|nr:DUF6544 family protein [Halanaerobacter jeridensis]MBM7557680.1 hypothetical protein [Halanaerobacter jeridensis]
MIKQLLMNYWWVILIIIIVLIILAVIIGNLQFKNKIAREKELLMKSSQPEESPVIREEDLANLPSPVKKWLKSVGVVRQERIKAVTFSQRGKMKLKPDQKNWIDAEAKQYVRVDEPGYLWHVNLSMLPLIHTKGRDLFYQGKGSMEIRLGSLIPVVNVSDTPKLNESALHRFLLELMWYPTAALEDYITWEAIGQRSAKAVLSYAGMSVEATFYFEEDGKLTKIEAMRYKESDADAERLPCVGEIKGYINVDGLKIPHLIDVTWVIDGENFTWYQLKNHAFKFERK